MKKMIIIWFTALIVFSTFPIASFAAEGSASYTISSESASRGETVELYVSLENNIVGGFIMGGFSLDYDNDNLTFQSVTTGKDGANLLVDAQPHNGTPTEVNYFKNDFNSITTGGTIAVLTFLVKDSAAAGVYEIGLKASEIGMQNNWFSVDGVSFNLEIIPTVNKGTITVPATSTYTAYLNTDAAEVAPGGTYTTDLYMKSDDVLSAGEIDLAAANGKITNIALADGIGMTQVDDVSDGKTEAKISFDGNTASAKDGLKIATVTVKANETAADTVDLSISQGVAAKTGSTKDQTVTLGEDAKVAVPIIANANCSCESYAAGKYLVKYTGTVVGSEVAKYGEEEMFWSPKYASWVYLANSDVSQNLRDSSFSSVSGTKKDITYTGDVNGNSVVNIVDAQVAYDIANGVYNDFTNPTMEQWLMADVNVNSMVEASDARAIQVYIHTQSWTDGVH